MWGATGTVRSANELVKFGWLESAFEIQVTSRTRAITCVMPVGANVPTCFRQLEGLARSEIG
jgi:hypothetical protein